MQFKLCQPFALRSYSHNVYGRARVMELGTHLRQHMITLMHALCMILTYLALSTDKEKIGKKYIKVFVCKSASLRPGLLRFNSWVSSAPEFQCCYFCKYSCLSYLRFNIDFYVSKIMHL